MHASTSHTWICIKSPGNLLKCSFWLSRSGAGFLSSQVMVMLLVRCHTLRTEVEAQPSPLCPSTACIMLLSRHPQLLPQPPFPGTSAPNGLSVTYQAVSPLGSLTRKIKNKTKQQAISHQTLKWFLNALIVYQVALGMVLTTSRLPQLELPAQCFPESKERSWGQTFALPRKGGVIVSILRPL